MSGIRGKVLEVLAVAAVVAGAVTLAARDTPRAVAEESESIAAPSPPEDLPPEVEARLAEPFKPYPAGEGAIPYEDLDPAEKAAADRAAEWADVDHGYAVHQRWSRASREAARLARLNQAQYDSGLSGLEGLGME